QRAGCSGRVRWPRLDADVLMGGSLLPSPRLRRASRSLSTITATMCPGYDEYRALALIPVAAVYDRRRHGLAVDGSGCTAFDGVPVAAAGGCTFGLGMGPDGIGSGVGVPCNFASRNLFRACAS